MLRPLSWVRVSTIRSPAATVHFKNDRGRAAAHYLGKSLLNWRVTTGCFQTLHLRGSFRCFRMATLKVRRWRSRSYFPWFFSAYY